MLSILSTGSLRGVGSSVVGKDTLNAILSAAPTGRFLAFGDAETLRGVLDAQQRMEIVHVDMGIRPKLLFESFELPRQVGKASADVILSLGDTGPILPRVPHILLIQQAYLTRSPLALPFPVSKRFRTKLLLQHAYFALGRRRVTRFIVQSTAMKKDLAEYWNIPEKQIHVIPSPISFPPDLPAFPLTGTGPNLGYVATPSPHKGHRLLPQVLAILRKKYPHLVLHLTIESQSIPGLVQEAEKLGVADGIAFHGTLPRDQTLALMSACDVVLFPSLLESYGLPYFEAMYLQKPLVVSDIPIAREACGDGARYAVADSSRSFAYEIDSILSNPADAEQLAEKGRQRFDEVSKGWKDVGKRFVALLEEVVRESRRKSAKP